MSNGEKERQAYHAFVEARRQRARAAHVELHALPLAEDVLQLLKIRLRRRHVPAEDGGLRERALDRARDGHVREQHELLHERVRLEERLGLDVDRARGLGGLQVDLDLWGREVERAGGHAPGLQLERERVQESDRLRDRVLLAPTRA
jgi:hypothetical protein